LQFLTTKMQKLCFKYSKASAADPDVGAPPVSLSWIKRGALLRKREVELF